MDSIATADAVVLHDGEAGDFHVHLHATRDTVLDTNTSSDIRDAVWGELIRRARTGDDVWQEIAIWMMIPKLRGIMRGICRRSDVEPSDVQSEVLLGFIEALHTVDPSSENLDWLLRRSAGRRGWRVREQRRHEIPVDDVELAACGRTTADHATEPRTGTVHADVITVTPDEAAGIRRRAEGERLGAVAQRLGLREHTRRRRGVQTQRTAGRPA